MTSRKSHLRAAALAAGLFTGSMSTLACGFEDPKSATIARGALNWAYPDALHVTSAVWRAQIDGLIPPTKRSPEQKSLLELQKVSMRLRAFRDGLAAVRPEAASAGISMVLIGPMLWSRFEAEGSIVRATIHAGGPSSSDVVIVTDEPVIIAMTDGLITPALARQLGLVRLYGAAKAVTAVEGWLDRWQPLRKSGAAENGQSAHRGGTQ